MEAPQPGLQVVLEAIRELCAPAPYKFAYGDVFVGEALLAFFMGGQPAYDKHFAKKSTSCQHREMGWTIPRLLGLSTTGVALVFAAYCCHLS